jgi:hypothetical protein
MPKRLRIVAFSGRDWDYTCISSDNCDFKTISNKKTLENYFSRV